MENNTNNDINNIQFPRKFVYFEKQSNDRLCGNHCINSLLQFPAFDPVQLGEIAAGLDELEKQLLSEQQNNNPSGLEENPNPNTDISSNVENINKNPFMHTGANFKNFFKKSENVDDDGNYNVQVLSEALKLFNCEIIPVRKSETEKFIEENMDSLEAFIFNSSTHWFAIRKIDNIWFNLNSTNPNPGPQIISDFYLSAFIKGTEELGYTNFLVKNLPELNPLDSLVYKNLQPYQKLVSIEDILKNKPKKINMGDTDEQALEKAIELSKMEFGKIIILNI